MLMLQQTVFSAGQNPTPRDDVDARDAGSELQVVEKGALPWAAMASGRMVCNWRCVIYVNDKPNHKGFELELP
jgi:hypothetical protein